MLAVKHVHCMAELESIRQHGSDNHSVDQTSATLDDSVALMAHGPQSTERLLNEVAALRALLAAEKQAAVESAQLHEHRLAQQKSAAAAANDELHRAFADERQQLRDMGNDNLATRTELASAMSKLADAKAAAKDLEQLRAAHEILAAQLRMTEGQRDREKIASQLIASGNITSSERADYDANRAALQVASSENSG